MDGLIAYALAKKYTDKVGQDIISAGFKVQVEDNRSILNRQGEEKVLYLLPKEYGSDQDGYDEFVYANNTWEWVGKTDVNLEDTFESKRVISWITNFEDSLTHVTSRGVAICTYANTGSFEQLPDFMKPLDNAFVIYNFRTATNQGLSQMVFWKDRNTLEAKMAFRMSTSDFIRVSDWKELGSGGSKIVSGVVNSNGTITFTDSEGNSFTTSGESVIGPPGDDYVLTAQDKTDIANIVLSELPTTEGVLYGN